VLYYIVLTSCLFLTRSRAAVHGDNNLEVGRYKLCVTCYYRVLSLSALYLKQSGVEFLLKVTITPSLIHLPPFYLGFDLTTTLLLLAIEHHVMSYSYTLPSSDPDPSNPDAHVLYSMSSSADPLNVSSYSTESSNASSNMPTLNTTSAGHPTPSSTARNGPMKNWCDRVMQQAPAEAHAVQ